FTETESLGAQWAKFYSERSVTLIYDWLISKKVSFLPVVNWPERGMEVKGNSVPRWHITWGTGFDLSNKVVNHLLNHPNKGNLDIKFQHKVNAILMADKKAIGVEVLDTSTNQKSILKSKNVIIAS